MAVREDKAELRARVYLLERERSALELKLSSQEAQQAAQQATVQHLQAQLQDVERRLQAQHQQVNMPLPLYLVPIPRGECDTVDIYSTHTNRWICHCHCAKYTLPTGACATAIVPSTHTNR